MPVTVPTPADPRRSPAASLSPGELSPLVQAARAGDRRAFGTLYERFRPIVHGILLAHVPRSEVPDLVQDVFLRALDSIAGLRDTEAFGAWLLTIARHEASRTRRRTRLHEPLTDDIRGSAPATPSLGTDDVLRALRALPERYREPLALRLIEEMRGEDIARATGLSHGTVRVYLHHGLRLLREQLGSAHD